MKYNSLEQIEKQIVLQGKRVDGIKEEIETLKADKAAREKDLTMAEDYDEYEKICLEVDGMIRKIKFLEKQLESFKDEKIPGLTVEDVAAAVNPSLESYQKKIDKSYKEVEDAAQGIHNVLKKYHDACQEYFMHEHKVANVLPCMTRVNEGRLEAPEAVHFANIPWVGDTKRMISFLYQDDIKDIFEDIYLRR